MNTYQIGEAVEIIGNATLRHITHHGYNKGDRCKIVGGPDTDEDYQLINKDGWKQWVHHSCFTPVSKSYSIEEYKNREIRALVDDEQPGDLTQAI